MSRTRRPKRPFFILQTYEDRIADQELKEKLSERLLAATQSNVTSHTNATGDAVAAAPPPPPPPPQQNGVKTKSKVVSTPTTANTTVIKRAVIPPTPPPPPTKNNPPPCPTPDYDSLSICSSTNGGNTVYSKTSTKCVKNDECDNGRIVPRNTDPSESVDMESLESFKLNNPARGHPKPPDIYFNGQQQQLRHQQACHGSRDLPKEGAHFVSKNTVKPQTATNIPPLATPPKPQIVPQYSTVRRTPAVNGHHRPVSITIGEYPTGTNRLRPGRLEFLHTSNVSSIQCDQNSSASSSGTESGTPCTSKSNSVTSQFASELAQTLNRSNLRKRTESLENLLNNSSNRHHCYADVHRSNATCAPPGMRTFGSNLCKSMAKSTNDLSSRLCLDYGVVQHIEEDTAARSRMAAATTGSGKSFQQKSSYNNGNGERKPPSDMPNGILKNCNGTKGTSSKPCRRPFSPQKHKATSTCQSQNPQPHTKSITFGDVATVISERPLQVS